MATPHDTLFRLAFGRPSNARDLLRKALPRSIARRIDWRSLRVLDASFIDRRLRKTQADLLFSALLRGRRVLLYVLIEHKSRDDRWTVLQLFTYMGAIWRRYRNWAWPSAVLVDKKGIVRFTHIGEGAYAEMEQRIQRLLLEP